MSDRRDGAPAVVVERKEQGNPFLRPADERLSAGAVAIESERAIAEAQGRLVLAKRFPRDKAKAWMAIMEECKRPGLAEEALYAFPRGKETISGPSIRLAEVIARCWTNLDFGLRELSRRGNESEMEAFAWDLETNTRSVQQFTVRHVRDTKQGPRALTDERDIYEIGANQGARRLRARILALIPVDVVEDAVAQVRRTMKDGGEQSMPERIKGMLAAFAGIGVAASRIEERLGHSLDAVTADELADLKGLYKSIRDNVVKADDAFPLGRADFEPARGAMDSLRDLAAKAKGKAQPEGGPSPDLAFALDRMAEAGTEAEIMGLVKEAAAWPAADQAPLIAAASKRREQLRAGGGA